MIINFLLLFIPLSGALAYLFHVGPLWVFFTAAIAIIPLAEWIRRATEQLAHIAGSAIGGLLNVTFGNAAELILAVFVLLNGHANVAKAQITGSIIGNSLLGLGVAALAATWGRDKRTFNRENAAQLSVLMLLSLIGLLIPALFDYTERGLYRHPDAGRLDEKLSLCASLVLISLYAANLVYTLVTHKGIFESGENQSHEANKPDPQTRRATLWKSLGILTLATVLTAFEAELVSGALEESAKQLGLTEFFLGVIVLAPLGNAAEYVASVYFARKDQMGLALTITVGSSIQVALFAAPVLVLVSYLLGRPMNLVFANPLELIAIGAAAFVVRSIAQDGEITWFEGVLLIGVYVLLGLAFFFATPD